MCSLLISLYNIKYGQNFNAHYPYMQKLEVLIINDGSKDRSSEIAHSYEKRFLQTFRVIDKENGNYGSCINRGLREATGKYVKILDADDWFDTVALTKFIQFLANVEADLVLNNHDDVYVSEEIMKTICYELPAKTLLNFTDYCDTLPVMAIQMHGVTYKTSIFKEIHYHQTEGISYTDQEWIFTPMIYVKSFIYFDEVLYKYLLGRAGQTMDFSVLSKNMNQFIIMVYALILSYYNHNILTLQVKKYLEYKLCANIKIVYNRLLLDSKGQLSVLEDFDNNLSKHKEIYELTSQIVINKKFPFKAIAYYRRKKTYLPWYVKLCYLLNKKWKSL